MNKPPTSPRFAPIPVAVFMLSALTFWAAEGWLTGAVGASYSRYITGLPVYVSIALAGWALRAVLEPPRQAEAITDRVDPGALALACAWPLALVVPQWIHLRVGRELSAGLPTQLFLAGGSLLPAVGIGVVVFRLSSGKLRPRTVQGVLVWLGLAMTAPYGGLACIHAHRFVRTHLGGVVPDTYWQAAAIAVLLPWGAAGLLSLPPARQLAARIGSFTLGTTLLLGLGALSPLSAPMGKLDTLYDPLIRPAINQPAEGAPDILLLTVDTLRADAVDWTPGGATPNLARLAERGTRFAQGTATSPWTLPSMASLWTGQDAEAHGVLLRPDRHGTIQGAGLEAETTTLPERLASAGYRTVAFASNPHLTRSLGFGRGFQYFWSTFEPPRLPLLAHPMAWEILVRRAGPSLLYREELLSPADSIVDRALLELERVAAAAAEDRRPLFLWVHLLDPHLPYGRADECAALIEDASYAHTLAHAETRDVRWGTLPVTDADRELWRAAYRCEVEAVDLEAGRLLDAWEATTGERGAVFFTSDHGEEFWEHGGFGHGHAVWSEVVDVPLAYRLAGQTQGDFRPERASLIDLTRTLAATAQASTEGLPGRDLREAEAGGDPTPIYVAFQNYDQRRRGVILGRWKMIEELDKTDRPYLFFDLETDPGEQRNLTPVMEQWSEERGEGSPPEGLEWYRRAVNLLEGRSVGEGSTQEARPETVEILRALGYVE